VAKLRRRHQAKISHRRAPQITEIFLPSVASVRSVANFFLAMQSEFDFINRIRAQVARRLRAPKDLVCGIGDDAAIIAESEGRETLITTDLLVEEIDFKLSYTPPLALGHKALAISLSDIAAMGGRPRFSLLTLGIPHRNPQSEIAQSSILDPRSSILNPQSDEYWEGFFAGYLALAERFEVTLIGGDVSATPERLLIDSIVVGSCERGKAVRRSGARVGDGVYITGEVGRAAAGLELLRRGERMSEGTNDPAQRALRAHLVPEPRVEFGWQVGERSLAHAMIDTSDGLAQDLAHVCEESRVGAVIDYEAVPVAAELSLVTDEKEKAFALAASGGEDFELLLTAEVEAEAALFETSRACRLRLARIGEIVAAAESERAPKLWLRRDGRIEPWVARGYDHFA